MGSCGAAAQFAAHHPARLLDLLADAHAAVHPAEPSLRDWLATTTRLRPSDMLLARRDLVGSYADWLWPVLEETVRRVEAEDVRLDGYQRRYPGFLAERLHGWWLEQRAREGLRVGEVGVAIVDAAGITNSGVLHGGAGVAVDRRPLGASGGLGALTWLAPFPLRVAVLRVARRARGR